MGSARNRDMHKVVLVTRKTRLTELICKYNTIEQARFYIEHMGVDFSDYVEEDRMYTQAVSEVARVARQFARVQVIDRSYVSNMIFGKQDVVIAVGQDGLVVNVMKYLDGQPLIGINPDPGRCFPFRPGSVPGCSPVCWTAIMMSERLLWPEQTQETASVCWR